MIEKKISEFFRKNLKPDTDKIIEKQKRDSILLKSLLK